MRILADENIPPALVEDLRARGHDVASIQEGQRGALDGAVAERSAREGRILLTYDKDFGELLYSARLADPSAGARLSGVVLLRLKGMEYSRRNERVVAVFESEEMSLVGAFTVVEPGRTRQRKLPGEASGT